MDYLIKAISEAIDKLTEAKGYVIGKKILEDKPKPVFKNNVIKFNSLIGRETSADHRKEVDVSMYKKPTMGSIKKVKNKDLYRGRFQYKGIVHETTSKKYIDCFDKHEAKIKEVMAKYNEIVTTNKQEFNKNTLLSEWWDYWYKKYKEPNISNSSKRQNHIYYNAYLKNSEIMKMRIGKITTFDIQELIDTIDKPHSKKLIKEKLNNCFKYLIKTNVLTFNPVSAVEIGSIKRDNKIMPIPTEKVNKIFDYFKNHKDSIYRDMYILLRFLLNSGLRVGEALALTWQNIDFKKKRIYVESSFSMKLKEIGDTKTYSSRRWIPMFNELEIILSNLDQSTSFVFENLHKSLETYMSTASKNLGFKIGFHRFRHNFASNCLAKGINPKTIQKWLGHSKLDITMNVYADVIDELEQSDIDKFNS